MKLSLVCSRSSPPRNTKFLLYLHLQIIQPPFCQRKTFIKCVVIIFTPIILSPHFRSPRPLLFPNCSHFHLCVWVGVRQPQLLCVLDDHILLRGPCFTTLLPTSCPYSLSVPSSVVSPGVPLEGSGPERSAATCCGRQDLLKVALGRTVFPLEVECFT